MFKKIVGKIIIVEDQESWRSLLETILVNDGYFVDVAASYDTAIEALRNSVFEIAILDMRLIDNSAYNIQGMQILQHIRKNYSHTKVIILTGFPDPYQQKRALSYGASAYISKVPDGKPFDINKFREIIQQINQSE